MITLNLPWFDNVIQPASRKSHHAYTPMLLLKRIRSGLRTVRLRDFSIATAKCPFCGPSLFVRLDLTPSGIRCLRCAASTVHLSLGLSINSEVGALSGLRVCEFSASGPLVDFLKKNALTLALSEFQEGAAPGTMLGGTRHEDVQQLSYPDHCFDLVTHTEVLEHVADDHRAFSELNRVLKPGGRMIFTVPFSGRPDTVERSRMIDGQVDHLLPAVYHTDPWRKGAGILAFRDYGSDIESRLREAGFIDIAIRPPQHRIPWLQACTVISARRAKTDSDPMPIRHSTSRWVALVRTMLATR